MKKLFCALLALLLCLAPSFAAFADGDGPYETAYELYASWGGVYPDYVAGVWSTDGTVEHLAFGLVAGAGEAEKAEILSQIRNTDGVEFVEGFKYSYNELQKLQVELAQYLGDEVYGIGTYETENRVHVDIDMADPGAREFMDRVAAEYGDMVEFENGYATASVEDGGGSAPADLPADLEEYVYVGSSDAAGAAGEPDDEVVYAAEPEELWTQAAPAVGAATVLPEPGMAQAPSWLLPAALLLLLLLAGALAFLKQKGLIFRTAEGPEGNAAPPSARRVEAAVRDSAETPDDRLRREIMKKLEK